MIKEYNISIGLEGILEFMEGRCTRQSRQKGDFVTKFSWNKPGAALGLVFQVLYNKHKTLDSNSQQSKPSDVRTIPNSR